MSSIANQQRRSDQVGVDHHDPLFGDSCIDSWRVRVVRDSSGDGERAIATPKFMGLLEEL